MRWIFIVLLSYCWMPVSVAEYRQTPGTTFELGELASELKVAVPELEGCDDTLGTITCRRLTGDFSAAERAAIDAVVAAHDPDIQAKRAAKVARDLASGDAKLKALGLTNDEIAARRR